MEDRRVASTRFTILENKLAIEIENGASYEVLRPLAVQLIHAAVAKGQAEREAGLQ